MECSKVKQFLFEYANGDALDNTKELIEEHLKVCIPCSVQYSGIQKMQSLLESLTTFKVPTDLKEEILKRLQGVEFATNKFKKAIKISATIVSASLLGFLTYKILGSSRKREAKI